MTINAAGPERMAAWQDFVRASPGAGPFHHAGWYHVLDDCFDVEPLFVESLGADGAIQGILPMYFSKSSIMGKHVATLEGGPLAAEPPVSQALLRRAAEIRDERGADYLLVRGGMEETAGEGRTVRVVRTVVDVSISDEQAWEALSSNTRRKVRKAEKNGFSIERAPEAVETFYGVYAANVRDLGTPVMGSCMMTAIAKRLKDHFLLYAVKRNGAVIGGMLLIANVAQWSSLYVAVDREALGGYPTYLLYWTVIKDAIRSSVAAFDMGRSAPESGTHSFKRQWSKDDRYYDHVYSYAPGVSSSQGPAGGGLHGGKTLKQKLWSKTPLPVTNWLGPVLRRRLPFF